MLSYRGVSQPSVVRASLDVASDLLRHVPDAASYVARLAGEAARNRPKFARPGYSVEVIGDDRTFGLLEADWDDLHRRSGWRSPFSSFPWLYGWWMEIGRGPDHDLRIVAVRHGRELVGLGAFYVIHSRTAREIHVLGDTYVGSEYLDVLCDPAHVEVVTEAVQCTLAHSGDFDAARLYDIDADSRFVAELLGKTSGFVGLEIGPDERLPYVRLLGSFDAFLATLSSNMRYNMKRKDKKLRSAYPDARLRLVERAEDIPRALADLFRLHSLRWQSKGQTGNFVRPEVQAFHRRVGPPLLQRGILRLYSLDVAPGKAAAMLYCLRLGKREFYLQAGMDPQYAPVSAGYCLMRQVIERCAEDGLEEFDMLRGTENYKNHWSDVERQTVRMRFARPTARGALWASRLKFREELTAIIKQHVPRNVIDEVIDLTGRGPPRPASSPLDSEAGDGAPG